MELITVSYGDHMEHLGFASIPRDPASHAAWILRVKLVFGLLSPRRAYDASKLKKIQLCIDLYDVGGTYQS